MTRIKNVSLAGEQLVTQYGTYVFDANGIVDVPDELAQKLATINGFTIIGKVDEDTQSGGEDTQSSGDVTLEGGVVWHKIEGGYIVSNDVITFTVTGSGVDSNVIPPENVTLQNGVLLFNENTDVANVHVKGVNEGETILIGDNTYKWWDVDGDLENGYELKIIEPVQTLPGGGTYAPIDGGYVLEGDGDAAFTVKGDYLDTEHLSIQNGELIVSEGADINNLVVVGVTENDTIQISDDTYKWTSVSDNPEDGMKLEFVPHTETLSGGGTYYPIDVGYVVSGDTAQFTLTGDSFDFDHISVVNNQLVLQDGIDTSNLHVKGVTEGDSIQVGNSIYIWENTDNISSNGYELTLISKGGWHTVKGGYVYDKDGVAYTLLGSAFSNNDVIPSNVIISNGKISLSPEIDKPHVHVIGVTPNDTIQIGDDTYKWADTDANPENGYELKLIPNTGWKMGGQDIIYNDGAAAYTISGPDFTFDPDTNAPTGVTIEGGQLKFDPSINTLNIHVKGVEENSVIQIGDNYYKWTNADGDASNGLELTLLDIPEGFEYDFDGKKFTVEGGIGSEITLEQLNQGVHFDENGKLIIGKDIVSSIDSLHIQGLESGSTINVAGEDYTLMDTDNDLENGYELVGGTDDAFDWRWSNRNRTAEPQIWRHYTGNSADIKVQGISARPTYNERAHTITLIGSEIASITNSTNADLKLAGDVTGVLSPNSTFSLKNGLVSAADGSYVYLDGILYVPNGSITNVSGNLEFTLINKKLTIVSGNLDVDGAVISGTAITEVSFANKNFLVSGNKLIRNAFSKRRTIRVS